MKKTVIVTIIVTKSLFSASLSSSEITNMVSKIKKERVGISLGQLDATQNPFLLQEVPKEVIEKEIESVEVVAPRLVERVYTLKSILNKAAFIDSKWYRKGDTLGNYTIGHISSKSVLLKSANGNKLLALKKKKKKFIEINRGYR